MDIVQFRSVISQGLENNEDSRSAFRKGTDKGSSVASLHDTFSLGFNHSASRCDPCAGSWLHAPLDSPDTPMPGQPGSQSPWHSFIRQVCVSHSCLQSVLVKR